MPAAVVAALPAAIETAKARLTPAATRDFAVCLDDLVGWIERFGLAAIPAGGEERRRWISGVVADYRDGLGDLPTDLLALAVKRVKAAHKWATIPKPADLRGVVEGEMTARRDALRRLELARSVAGRQRPSAPPPSDSERAHVAEMMAAFRAGVEIRRINGRADDGAPDPALSSRSDRRAALARVERETAARRSVALRRAPVSVGRQ